MSECKATPAGYVVAGEHYDDCEGECAGCFPCVPRDDLGAPLDHCTARARCTAHIEWGTLTCAGCLGRARRMIRRIGDLSALLPVAAVESGSVESPAADLAGPACDPAGWSEVKVAAMRDGTIDALPDDDVEHPYAVLGRWQMKLENDPRECYPVDRHLITVPGAVAYLDRALDQFAGDDEQDFPLFVREAAACLARVETVLAVAVRPETGAPCPACAERGTDKPPRLVLRRDERDTTGARDRWRCPDCRASWTDAEYRLRIGTDYARHASALTASQLHHHYRINPGRLRQWAVRGLVAVRGFDGQRRRLYDRAQALEARDRRPERGAS